MLTLAAVLCSSLNTAGHAAPSSLQQCDVLSDLGRLTAPGPLTTWDLCLTDNLHTIWLEIYGLRLLTQARRVTSRDALSYQVFIKWSLDFEQFFVVIKSNNIVMHC